MLIRRSLLRRPRRASSPSSSWSSSSSSSSSSFNFSSSVSSASFSSSPAPMESTVVLLWKLAGRSRRRGGLRRDNRARPNPFFFALLLRLLLLAAVAATGAAPAPAAAASDEAARGARGGKDGASPASPAAAPAATGIPDELLALMPQVLDIGAQDSELQDRRREEQTPRGNHGRENRELTDVTPLIGNGYYYNFRKPKGEERVTYCESCYTGQNVLNAYLYLPYTFQTAGCVRLNVVQTSGKNVQYEVRDYGTVVGYTSVPAAIDCRILANLGACCTQGDFVFGPGSHSVDVYGLSDVQDTGAIKLDPVPCPTSPAPPTAPLTRRPSPAPAPAPVTPMPTRVGTGTGEYSSASSLQRGVWYTFATDDNTYPSWAYGCGPDTDPRRAKCVSTPGVTASANDIPAPWTYATGPTTCSRVVVTDMWFNDNLYELYDAGVSVGRTRASIGDGSPSGGPSCGDNPLVCVASPISSSGAFQLGPGQHSLEIRGFFSLRDRGAFMIQTVPCPTKSPTKRPTKSPTKRPSKSPTSRPTRAPTSAPTRSPTAAPTAVPTRAPTGPPTRSPTKTPIATRSCPAAGSATRFSIWNGNTNRVAVARMVSGRSYCLSGNWNIRATTLHEKARCGPVEVSLWRAPAGRRATAVRKFKDPAPRFFLFGDNAATGDVYGNAQIPSPLVLTKGQRYCVRSKEPLATGISEVCFTQSC